MQFYFIRHAQSANNALYVETGSDAGRSEDPELTDTGWKQADHLAQFVSRNGSGVSGPEQERKNANGFHFTHLYSSPMVRAVATASIVSEATGLPVLPWVNAHECGGVFLQDDESGELIGKPGKNRHFFNQHYPCLVVPDTGWETGWWNRGFETHQERDPRAIAFLQELLSRHGGTDDRVAIVSHGGFYNHFLRAVLGISERNGYWFAIHNASITRIDFIGEETVIQYTNRTDFLQPELIT